MELPVGNFAESYYAATLWGFADKTSKEVVRLTEVYESMEGIIVATFDCKEDVSPKAASARAAFARAEQHMSAARERLAIAVDNHSSFVIARIVRSRPLGVADERGNGSASATDEEELMDKPKLLKRKLTEPSKD